MNAVLAGRSKANDGLIILPRFCRGCVYESRWGNMHLCCNAYLETKGKKRPENDGTGHCVHHTPKGRKT